MDLIERFSGQRDPETPFGELVANPEIVRPISYQLLFMNLLDLDADALTLALRSFHPLLAQARAEILEATLEDAPAEESRSIFGLAGWANHVVKIVGFDNPIPPAAFDDCVRPAFFADELKEQARKHKSHLLLHYAGYESDPLEQYVALSVVAAALGRFDAILVLNGAAHQAIPAALLTAEQPGDPLDNLRGLPIPLLYGGFEKIEIEDEPGVWIRTFGNVRLNLPDLAFHAEGHHQGSETFANFASILEYLRESGADFAPGNTIGIDDDVFMRVRSPTEAEWYLESDGRMLVVERITAAEVNRHE